MAQLTLKFETVNRNTQQFKKAISNLNEAQRQAVQWIDGPALVIAGPGTGKTEILALRIGNILQTTDAQPHNILCLTYTEAGTVAMRNRLLYYIGPAAYQVHIHTFHSFCNHIILDHPELFGDYAELSLATELDIVDILRKILSDLPLDHPLKRLTSKRYYELGNLKKLFDDIKRENKTIADLEFEIDQAIANLYQDDKNIYKTNKSGKKGELNKSGQGKENRWRTVLKAAQLVDQYNLELKRGERYDYNDMIHWVLDAFKSDEDFLAEYQERFQYILVDEYQDTNGSQNEILHLLNAYWEKPNLFAVGDDDQAIYRFQGANVANMQEFIDKYQPIILILPYNYRSTQNILNWAGKLITENKDRLVNRMEGLTKELIASAGHAHDLITPKVIEYPNQAHEEASIMDKIVKAHHEGIPYREIAVIYRQHNQAENIIKVLERKGIPVNVKRKVDILKNPLVQNLINILKFIAEEFAKPNSSSFRLFELMHYPFFEIDSADVARISLECRYYSRDQPGIPWRGFLRDSASLAKLDLHSLDSIVNLERNLSDWIQQLPSVTIQTLFERILKHGNILKYVMHLEEKNWILQIVTSFFEFIKEETRKNPLISLSEFLHILDKMEEHMIPLELHKIVYSDDGVNFLTAHGSKGLEFTQVFLMGVTENYWEKKKNRRARFEIPAVTENMEHAAIEDERRLLYVAMTRAKKHLEMSYSTDSHLEKPLNKSLFLAEIIDQQEFTVIKNQVVAEDLLKFYVDIISPEERTIDLIDKNWIDFVLQRFVLNATALNKYLNCPLRFYFENILRVPTARTEAMGFGQAIHYAFEQFFRNHEKHEHPLSQDNLLGAFQLGMDRYQSHFTLQEFEEKLYYGKKILTGYYDQYRESWTLPQRIFTEQSIQNVTYKDVPIAGILDKVELFNSQVRVTDYKTGSLSYGRRKTSAPKPTNDNLGGDYWRQVVFYKILIDADPKRNWNMVEGIIDFVQPNKEGDYFRKKQEVSDQDIELVGEQIVDTYQKIKEHEFNRGCGKEDCYWCNFVKYNFDADKILDAEEYDD